MVNMIDMLQCPICGTFYTPEATVTGRLLPHCRRPTEHQLTEYRWLDGEAYVDFAAIERRMLTRYGLTGAVEGPPLTGSLLDIEV